MQLKIGKLIHVFIYRTQSLILSAVACFACTALPVVAEKHHPDVVFSGIAYLGNYSHIQQNYSYALNLNSLDKSLVSSQPRALDKHFLKVIRDIKPQLFNLQFGLADLRKGQSIAMALAIESESVSTEVIGTNRKIIVEAAAQLFFFDFATMTLLANFPVNLATNHVVKKDIDYMVQLPQLFSDLYLGKDSNKGLLSLAAEVSKHASLDLSKTIRFQLEQVTTENKVQAVFPADLTVQRFNQFIGQYFSARLANNYKIAVLPFTKGYAIGNQMAGRFANGNVFNLNLPPADYTFALAVNDLIKAPYKDNVMYASRVGFSLTQKVSNKVYFNDLFQYAVPKLVTHTMTEIDDWSAYHDAIEVLIDDLIIQLGEPNKDWFKTHAKDKQAYKKFKIKQTLFTPQ